MDDTNKTKHIIVIICLIIILIFCAGYTTFNYYGFHLERHSGEELPSPSDIISRNQIHVYDDKIVIDIENASWSSFIDTNSMDPLMDYGAHGFEIKPKNELSINVGDIITYNSIYTEYPIVHRVIEIDYDKHGWYAILKGDNNLHPDPEKVRFDDVEGILIGIIY